jgi:hypothetical protein
MTMGARVIGLNWRNAGLDWLREFQGGRSKRKLIKIRYDKHFAVISKKPGFFKKPVFVLRGDEACNMSYH